MAISDIAIYEEGSGGEMALVSNDLATIQGLTNQFYLAFFGGNIEEDTTNESESKDQRFDWWGNVEVKEKFNSTFERTLRNVSLNSAGLKTLENSAKEDLKYLSDIATINVTASLVGVGKLQLLINYKEPERVEKKIKYIWDGTRLEIIITKDLI